MLLNWLSSEHQLVAIRLDQRKWKAQVAAVSPRMLWATGNPDVSHLEGW